MRTGERARKNFFSSMGVQERVGPRAMQSSVDAERTLHNLHILGALSHNDKLMTNDDRFDIYQPTSFRGMMRAVYGERRLQNVQRVRQTVSAGIAFATKALEEANTMLEPASASKHPPAPCSLPLRIETIALEHFRMMAALHRARDGLTNLLQTYRDDAALASQITLLTDELDDMRRILLPHSDLLRQRLTPSASSP